jgi:hypothetical protein
MSKHLDRLTVEYLPITKIKPYDRNPRRNRPAVAKTAASLKEFGWRQPIVVDRDMVIVVGHTRYMAAQQLGQYTVPVHIARNLTPEQLTGPKRREWGFRTICGWISSSSYWAAKREGC